MKEALSDVFLAGGKPLFELRLRLVDLMLTYEQRREHLSRTHAAGIGLKPQPGRFECRIGITCAPCDFGGALRDARIARLAGEIQQRRHADLGLTALDRDLREHQLEHDLFSELDARQRRPRARRPRVCIANIAAALRRLSKLFVRTRAG